MNLGSLHRDFIDTILKLHMQIYMGIHYQA